MATKTMRIGVLQFDAADDGGVRISAAEDGLVEELATLPLDQWLSLVAAFTSVKDLQLMIAVR